MDETPAVIDQEKELKGYRRRLFFLMLLSSGIDIAIFTAEVPLILTFWGASLVVDEIIEYFVSVLLARNKMRMKKRYKIAGIIPLPGVTALTLQSIWAMWRSYRKPDKVVEELFEEAEEVES